MKYTLILATISMVGTGCGVNIHADPVKVDPIQVNHVITVNTPQLEQFYKLYCEAKFNDQLAADQCVTDSLANFWLAIKQATPPDSQVQPSGGTTQ